MSINHLNVYNNIYEAINGLKTILETAGLTVEMNKSIFFNSSSESKLFNISFDNAEYIDVEEQSNNNCYINLFMLHFLDSDLDLFMYLKTTIYPLFNDYTWGGTVKKAFPAQELNSVQDTDSSKSYYIIRILVEI